jgi:hypothetical protein
MMNPGEIIRALWCRDSETGAEVLVDLDSNTVIARRVDGKIIDPTPVVKEEPQKSETV